MKLVGRFRTLWTRSRGEKIRWGLLSTSLALATRLGISLLATCPAGPRESGAIE